MNLLTKLTFTLVLLASVALAQAPVAPQGRLTLTSGTPVMTGVTGATTIYYAPYVGQAVPLISSNTYSNHAVGTLSLALNSAVQTAGNIYDVFVFVDPGTGGVMLGAGPAWASLTSRGSGAGTTEIEQSSTMNDIWVAKNAITLDNGTNSYSINNSGLVGNWATYVGSFYATQNGQTSMQFSPAPASGGTNSILGLYNAYNRVTVSSRSVDSTGSWSYNSTTWRAADNSTSNRITWLDGLQQSFVRADYQIQATASSSTAVAFTAIGLDSTTTPQTSVFGVETGQTVSVQAASDILPQFGLHYVQALESVFTASVTFYSDNASYITGQLKVNLEL